LARIILKLHGTKLLFCVEKANNKLWGAVPRVPLALCQRPKQQKLFYCKNTVYFAPNDVFSVPNVLLTPWPK